jgi:hypothetical protein
MKYAVAVDKWYPVFLVDDSGFYSIPIELSDEEYARYKAAAEEFNAVQDLLEERYKKAGGGK